MEARLQKWGNSDGIRIPSNILKTLNLKTNDRVDIYEQDNKIIISKQEKKHITLKERINDFNKIPQSKRGNVVSYDWQEDVGLEKWD